MTGKGVKFIVGGIPADKILSELNKNLKETEDTKKRIQELKKLFDKTKGVMSSGDFSEDEIKSIKSALDEVKEMEKTKLQSCFKDLAKKIKEYSDNNNK